MCTGYYFFLQGDTRNKLLYFLFITYMYFADVDMFSRAACNHYARSYRVESFSRKLNAI